MDSRSEVNNRFNSFYWKDNYFKKNSFHTSVIAFKRIIAQFLELCSLYKLFLFTKIYNQYQLIMLAMVQENLSM